MGTEVRLREGRGGTGYGATQLDDRQDNNSHELPPMVFRDSGLVFKFNYAVATKVGQWSPCLCQKTCALLDPMDDGGTQEKRNVKGVLSC